MPRLNPSQQPVRSVAPHSTSRLAAIIREDTSKVDRLRVHRLSLAHPCRAATAQYAVDEPEQVRRLRFGIWRQDLASGKGPRCDGSRWVVRRVSKWTPLIRHVREHRLKSRRDRS